MLLGPTADDPLPRIFRFNSLGTIAVFGFFFISGYLILKSALRWSSPEDFLAARALRIFPGLACVTLLCVFLLGPCITTLPLHDYFASPATHAFLGELVLHRTGQPLPGVFVHNPWPLIVDGPLWTLPIEWLMYMATLAVCLLLRWRSSFAHRRGRTWLALAAAAALTLQMFPLPFLLAGPWSRYFLLGALCYTARRWIVLSLPLAIAAFFTVLFLLHSHAGYTLGTHLFAFALCYLLLSFGFHPAAHLSLFHGLGDPSYGLYIYSWPIQQLLAPHFHSTLIFFLATYALTLAIALLSWRFVENPSLRLKSALRHTRALVR
jgi:peptidoglycan/LPS O-acetylase OafA/YrhL